MGKRGPAPKPQYQKKERPTGVRMRSELRVRLENAAAQNRVTLSREIETRLALSFEQTQKMYEMFGDQMTFCLMQQIASTVGMIQEQTQTNWWNDRFTFDLFQEAIEAAIEVMRPPRGKVGKPVSPPAGPSSSGTAVAPVISRKTNEELRGFGREAMLLAFGAIESVSKGSPLAQVLSADYKIAAAYLTAVFAHSPLELYALDQRKKAQNRKQKR